MIGFGAGLLSGLLGVGGGVVLVPAMVYLLHLSQHQAHGTSLAVILFAAAFRVFSYALAGDVEWPVVGELALGGVVGAPIGAWTAGKLRARTLRHYFGIFLLLVALRMLFDVVDAFFIPGGSVIPDKLLQEEGIAGFLVVIVIGATTGFLSGLLGVGGGILMVPAMTLLLGMSQQLAQGNSLAVIVPISITGAFAHFRNGNVRLNVMKWLVPGAVVGAPIGGQIAVHLNENALVGVFGLLLLALGLRMLTQRD